MTEERERVLENSALAPPPGGTVRVTGRLLRRYLPGEMRGVLLGLLLVLGSSGVALLQPWPLKLVLDHVLQDRPPPSWLTTVLHWLGMATSKTGLLLALCLGLLVIEILLGALNISSAYLLHSVALRMVFKLRCALFDHVQRLSLITLLKRFADTNDRA